MSRKDNRTTEEFLLELKDSGNWNDDSLMFLVTEKILFSKMGIGVVLYSFHNDDISVTSPFSS